MKEGFLPGSLAVLAVATVIVTAVGLIVFRRRNLRA
jgi:putative exporter of polyketide antibiotics